MRADPGRWPGRRSAGSARPPCPGGSPPPDGRDILVGVTALPLPAAGWMPGAIPMAASLVALLLLGCSERDPGAAGIAGQACEDCHAGIEVPGPGHDLECAACHVAAAPSSWDRRPAPHPAVAANPSSPEHWEHTCGSCHAEQLARIQRSLHWTQTGVINHTRYLLGAQPDVVPPAWTLQSLAAAPPPDPAAPVTAPADVADDLLRRRCLRCHLMAPGGWTPGQGGDAGPAPAGSSDGLWRGSGCAACHVPYAADGRSWSGDAAVRAAGTAGRPRRHVIQRPSTSDPCLACHHGDATGADYAGLMPADDHADYRVPEHSGLDRPALYGADQRRLRPDLHHEAGMICTDCHGVGEVMGTLDGPVPALEHEAVTVRCADCHAEALAAGGNAAHDVVAHASLTCAACHARWAPQSFGLHLHRSLVPTWDLWIPRALQGDPELTARVAAAAALSPEARAAVPPAMTDRITGEERPGLWAAGRTLRRWEEPALGVTADGRYAPLRPRHGYRVTAVDAAGLVVLDDREPTRGDGSGSGRASEPFTPHTTAPAGAACTRCHGNLRAAGLGIAATVEDGALHAATVPDPPATPGARLLTDEERARLLDPSAAQRAAHAAALRRQGIEALLPVGD